jgi:integrase
MPANFSPARGLVKIGHIEICVRQYADGRWGFDDYSLGRRRMVRLHSKQKADARATDLAVLLANGRHDLLGINRAELTAFREWKAASSCSRCLSEICAEFLQIKRTKSSRHVQSLERDLRLFVGFIGPTRPIAALTAPDIQRFLNSRNVGRRRQFNLRAGIVSMFRWARRMSYLPDRLTEAEKVESIERTPGKPNILAPDQIRILLDNVRQEYLPWLAIAAFAGIRSEEIAPDPKSKKSPLAWEDFDWKHRRIIVREETSKTKEEREVPLAQNLAEWLAPWRGARGRVCTHQPTKAETARLGKFIGGWKHNALRDSFCGYRARITQNIPQVSYEMGNSVAMVKRSYHRNQPMRAARQWFNIRPSTQSGKILRFPKKVSKSIKIRCSANVKIAPE